MTTKVTISFSSAGRPLEVVERLLIRSGLPGDLARRTPDELDVHTIAITDETSARRLRSALAKEGIEWIERTERVRGPDELPALPLLRISVKRAPSGIGGPASGTEYDLSAACPRCGTGAIQTSPLFLKRSEVPKTGDIFETLDGEILVSPALCKALQDEAVSGAQFVRAKDAKTKADLDWIQISAVHELPKMLDSSPGLLREDPCPECKHDGYFMGAEEDFELHYRAAEVRPDDLPDVARTYERFGNSAVREPFNKSHFALPLLVIKSGVADVVERRKVRAIEFDPVRLID